MVAARAIPLNASSRSLPFTRPSLTIIDQIDRFTRPALKGAGQCRATFEMMAAIKNPPTVFARQANIAHGARSGWRQPESALGLLQRHA
jgi:hypothetical protein